MMFVGHSFLTRFKKDVEKMAKIQGREVYEILQVEYIVDSVEWEVKAGTYLSKLKKMYKQVKSAKSDVLIVEIGSNDLTNIHSSPQRLALEIVKVLQKWTSGVKEIKKILICQVTNKGELIESEKNFGTI